MLGENSLIGVVHTDFSEQQVKLEMNFVAIDFETANYQPNSACAIGLVKVVNGVIADKAVYLIKPPTREFVFTYIHGLTWRDVAREDDFGKLRPRIESLLKGAEFLAAHNASFDKRVLEACCATYGISMPSLPFQCTVQVARRTWSIYPTKLSNVCQKLQIELNHHEALSDAMACARIVLAARCKVSGASVQHKDFSPFTQQPTTRSTFNAISFRQGYTELFEPRPWTHGVRPLLQHERDHQRDHSRLSFDNVTEPPARGGLLIRNDGVWGSHGVVTRDSGSAKTGVQ